MTEDMTLDIIKGALILEQMGKIPYAHAGGNRQRDQGKNLV